MNLFTLKMECIACYSKREVYQLTMKTLLLGQRRYSACQRRETWRTSLKIGLSEKGAY